MNTTSNLLETVLIPCIINTAETSAVLVGTKDGEILRELMRRTLAEVLNHNQAGREPLDQFDEAMDAAEEKGLDVDTDWDSRGKYAEHAQSIYQIIAAAAEATDEPDAKEQLLYCGKFLKDYWKSLASLKS